ncbi:MAG TPA: hypothetical protein VN706_14350 [Gemmatimonadaceae bacterium]|nr:hypothetical protein [Gemmatimonadaceae bacterium]
MQGSLRTLTFSGVAAAGLMVAAACSSDNSLGVNGNSSSQLAFTTASTGASFAAVPVTSGGHTLNLTAVTVTVARAELKRAESDNCPGDNDNDDDHPAAAPSTAACGELKLGPFNVNLPLDTTLVTLPANTIPAGTFREFELRVSRVELKGTFDGTAFDDTIAVDAKSEVQFSTPLVVTDSTPTSITVNVPVKNWLVNADGSLVDPTKLATSPSLLAQVKARIAASFRAFEDRNHDGHDDHDGGGHDGKGGND